MKTGEPNTAESKNCKNCGTQVLSNARFCKKCGQSEFIGSQKTVNSGAQDRSIPNWPKIFDKSKTAATLTSIILGAFYGMILFMLIIPRSIRYLACLESDNQTVSCDSNSQETQFDWIINLLITSIMLIVIYVGYRKYKVIFSRVEWVEMNAVLASSEIKKKRGGENTPSWYTLELQHRYDWQGIEYHKKIDHGKFTYKDSAKDFSKNFSPDQIFKLLVDPNNPNRSIEYKGMKNTELANLKFIGAILGSYIFALIIYNSDILFFIIGIIPVLLFLKLNNYVNKEISSNDYWNKLIELN